MSYEKEAAARRLQLEEIINNAKDENYKAHMRGELDDIDEGLWYPHKVYEPYSHWRPSHEQELAWATDYFGQMATLLARAALGQGLTRETVAMVLNSLAEVIVTQDCAESMAPIEI